MKLCKICHIRPATLPDRDYQGIGRVRKEVCELCHAERLRADLRSILAKKKKEAGMKYRKKPVVIEAIQYDGSSASVDKIMTMGGTRIMNNSPEGLYISTLEGIMKASKGDWIIKGVQGELYPCKPDIFHETYEEAEK